MPIAFTTALTAKAFAFACAVIQAFANAEDSMIDPEVFDQAYLRTMPTFSLTARFAISIAVLSKPRLVFTLLTFAI